MCKKATLLLCLALGIVACTGCTIGIKTERTLTFVSPVPIPEAAKGAPIVATNAPIPLAIIDKPDATFKQNVGGYVLVDPWFYRLLIEAWDKQESGK